jgi:hypothetical protein
MDRCREHKPISIVAGKCGPKTVESCLKAVATPDGDPRLHQRIC